LEDVKYEREVRPLNKRLLKTVANIFVSILRNRLNIVSYPSYCTFMVTWRCNAKCVMCDIWRKKYSKEMTVKEIESVFTQLKMLDVIKITGGEPFLRYDLVEVVNTIQREANPFLIHITTNGLLTDAIKDFIKSVDKPDNIHLKISIDAVGESHDKIRGVRGAYERAMETLKELAKLRETYHFYLGVNQTIVHENMGDTTALREICRKLNVGLHQTIAQDKAYLLNYGVSSLPKVPGEFKTHDEFSLDELIEVFNDIGKAEIKDFLERMVKRYYLRGLYNRLVLSKPIPKPMCVALRSHLRILPEGNIPICLYDMTIVGNLMKDKFTSIWFSDSLDKYRERVKKCPGCWIGCETIPNAIYSGDFIIDFPSSLLRDFR